MSLNVEVKHPYLTRLVCAYTGKPAGVRMVASGKHPPVFFAASAFDPGAYVASSQELFRLLSFRNGIEGAARNGEELVCPYTGAKLTVIHRPGLGFKAVGGLRPSQPQPNPAAFARAMMSRNGVVPVDAPKDPPRLAASRIEDTSPEEMPPQIPIDAAAELAETVLEKTGAPLRTSVTVPEIPKSNAAEA